MLLTTEYSLPRNSDTALLLPHLELWVEMYFNLFKHYVVAN